MRGAHAVAAVIEDAAGQKGRSALKPDLPRNGVGGELSLHRLEQAAVENWLLLSPVHLTAINDLADVESVLEQMGQSSRAEADMAPTAAICEAASLGPDTTPVKLLDQGARRAKFQVACKDETDRVGLLGDDDGLLAETSIAERDRAADPDPFALGGRNLIAHALSNHLALELREREQHIERQPPHAARGVERLCDRDERHGMRVKEFGQLGEIGE